MLDDDFDLWVDFNHELNGEQDDNCEFPQLEHKDYFDPFREHEEEEEYPEDQNCIDSRLTRPSTVDENLSPMPLSPQRS